MSNQSINIRFKMALVLYVKGFCMGIADLIPGISGGTIALILGIYEQLVDAIKSFDAQFFKLLFRFKLKEAFAGVGWEFGGGSCPGNSFGDGPIVKGDQMVTCQ